MDLPGFGEAVLTEARSAPWDDVLQTLSELDIPPATLVGDSFGAAVALRVAVVAPEAVRALMLVSPPPLDLEPSAALAAAWDTESAALERGDIDTAVAAVVDAWLQPGAPSELRARVAAMQRRAFELQSAVPDVEEAPDPLEQRPQELAKLQSPVLAVAGEADMPDFMAGAKQIAESVPHGEFAVIKEAGHLAPLEAPAEFRELLLGFLRSEAA